MVDHVIYAAPDLEHAIAEFTRRYGITPSPGGSHIGFGTRNALVGLDKNRYLEIVAIDPQQDVPANKRFLTLDATSTPSFAGWCARASRPLEETVAIGRAAGCDFGEILSMSRSRPDGTTLSWTLTFALRRTRRRCAAILHRQGQRAPSRILAAARAHACFAYHHSSRGGPHSRHP